MATTKLSDVSTTDAVRLNLEGKGADTKGLLFQAVLLISLLISLAALVTLLATVFVDGLALISDRGSSFLTQGLSSNPEEAGVWQGLYGSFFIAVFVILLAFPIGIGAAIYLEEYAPSNRITNFIDVNIRNLAGVPSVVYGILGLTIFVQTLDGVTGGRSVISGGLTLAILVLPIVIITSAEALRAVPQSIREAGFGVGSTRWEVVRSHVLPYAAPGILTGTVLSLARAIGEAAPLILVGAASGFFATPEGASLLERLQGPFTAMPDVIYNWARQPRQEFRDLTSAAIVVMLAVVLTANAAAILLRNYFDKRRVA